MGTKKEFCVAQDGSGDLAWDQDSLAWYKRDYGCPLLSLAPAQLTAQKSGRQSKLASRVWCRDHDKRGLLSRREYVGFAPTPLALRKGNKMLFGLFKRKQEERPEFIMPGATTNTLKYIAKQLKELEQRKKLEEEIKKYRDANWW